MDKKKTLVILIPGFPEIEEDTTCLPFQQSFVTYLSKTNPTLTIRILAFQYPYTQKEYKFRSVSVYSFGGKNKRGLSRLLLQRKVQQKLKEINVNQGIDTILSFWCGECALAGGRFAKRNGIKHFTWLMGQDAKKDNRYVKKIRPTAVELIALSDFLQDEFERNHGIRPQQVISPGLDTDSYPLVPVTRDIDILAAGSLIPLKQFEHFVTVVAEVRKIVPNVSAILAGDGPEKESLKKLIEKYQLQSNIKLAGELPHHILLQLMQRAKLFIHPSSYEGFGIVCIEALYAGANVISFVQPMKKVYSNWYIAATEKQMADKAISLLLNTSPANPASFDFEMAKCVGSFLKLLYQ